MSFGLLCCLDKHDALISFEMFEISHLRINYLFIQQRIKNIRDGVQCPLARARFLQLCSQRRKYSRLILNHVYLSRMKLPFDIDAK